jgi:hypothetical protein
LSQRNTSLKNPKVSIRDWGKAPRKHGILLKFLTPDQKRFLFDNDHLKFISRKKDTMEAIFHVFFQEQLRKDDRAAINNPFTGTFTNRYQLNKDAQLVDWNCGICKADIKSSMIDYSPENFLCDKCKEAHSGAKKIDSRIKQNSLLFTEHCKNMLTEEQKTFLKFLKINRKQELLR